MLGGDDDDEPSSSNSNSQLNERMRLALLVFDEETRVRKAVSAYVSGLWNERLRERLVGRPDQDVDDLDADSVEVKFAGAKALAMFIVDAEKALVKLGASPSAGGEESLESDLSYTSLLGAEQKSRVALAVEALWDDVDAVRDWQALVDILLLDHSGSGASGQKKKKKAKKGSKIVQTPKKGSRAKAKLRGKATKDAEEGDGEDGGDEDEEEDDDVVDEAWRLDDVEESILLDVLVASLGKALAEEDSKKGVRSFLLLTLSLLLTDAYDWTRRETLTLSKCASLAR